MSYSSNISISGRLPIYEASFVLHLPYEEWRLPLIQFRVRQPIYALGFENTSAFRFKTALNDSYLPHLFFVSSVLSPAKLVCRILVHMATGVPESSSSSTSRHPFPIFFENSLLVELKLIIFFKIISLLALLGQSFTSCLFKFSNSS